MSLAIFKNSKGVNDMNYKVTIVEQPARYLAGLFINANMNDTQNKCPDLWGVFMPRMEELFSIAEEGSFGVCVNMEENGGFDYWTAMAVHKNAKNPSDFRCLEINGGKYAECVVENLSKLAEAYQYMYGEWGNTQKDCHIDFTAACYEFYKKDWQETDSVLLYVPVMVSN